MQFEKMTYQGWGVNHEGEKFEGTYLLKVISEKLELYAYEYTARLKNNVQVHTESGLITKNCSGDPCIVVQMEELPVYTTHKLVSTVDNEFTFTHSGEGLIDDFRSELILSFNDSGFKYLHRWGMGSDPIDRSWCDLM